MRQLVECVPNFSEGRDAGKIDAIVQAILAVPEVVLLDREADADHNRSVLTFVGPPSAVADAAFRAVEKAVARRPERTNLENIRRGQFEALVREMGTVPARDPDIGDPVCHPTAGATVTGARKFLIAYNINLHTPDVAIAKRIAKTIRFSSGGCRYVKSMGVMLSSRNLAQVSINLTDFEQTPMHVVFEAVRREAERYGVAVAGNEIVCLIPRKAIELSAEYFLRYENFRPELVLENRIAEALSARSGLPELLNALAAPSATPGGGSAAW